ncbi:MAG: glycosyltransferase family 39 protein [Phycisphaerae bacterium]|nr:glycosyltransferase family 39 protein [Phycisphaerae bacterium]
MTTEDTSTLPNQAPPAELSTTANAPGSPWLRRGLTIILLVYLGTYVIFPQGGFWINDNECKFIQLQGMIQSHYQQFSIPWPGREWDPDLSYNPLIDPFGYVVDGQLYCFTPPVFPLISSFLYRIWGFGGLYVLPLAAGLLMLPGVWRLAGLLSGGRAGGVAALFLVALATPVWFYSMTFWELVPAACLTTWSVVFCLEYVARDKLRHLALSAVWCALAVYFRDDLYVFGLVLAVVSAVCGRSRRVSSALGFVLTFAVCLIPLWWFQWMALGHPLGHHFMHHSPLDCGLLQYILDRWAVAKSLLIDCHASLSLSLVVSIPYLVLWVGYPRMSPRLFGWMVPLLAGVATAGGLIVMAGHLSAFSPIWWLLGSNSLFAVSPILLLAFVRRQHVPGIEGQSPQHPDREAGIPRVLWLILSLYTLAFMLLIPRLHSTGIHWGARLLLPAYPLLGVMASCPLARWWQSYPGRRRIGKAVIGITIGLSVAIQVYSLDLLHRRKTFSAGLNHLVARRPEKVIVTGYAAMPQYLSHSFYTKKIFLLQSQEDVDRIVRRAGDAGLGDVLLVNGWRPAPALVPGTAKALHDGGLNYIAADLRPLPTKMRSAPPHGWPTSSEVGDTNRVEYSRPHG